MTPRRYSKVSRRIWNDAKFRSLSAPPPNAQTLFLRLLTGPELTNIPGLIPVGEAALAEALGWPLEGFREAFREVFREGLAEGDWEARLVFVPKAIFHNEPESPNVIKAWAPAWDEAPECDLKTRAWEALRDYAKAKGSGWLEAFDKACPKPSGKAIEKASAKAFPKPSANQEQEQEQEQKDLPSTPAEPPPSGPSVQEQIRTLSARYDAELVAEAREAVALSRRTGKVSDSVWLRTLKKLETYPLEAAVHAMRVFAEKHADGDKGEAYLVAIAKREANAPKRDGVQQSIPRPAKPSRLQELEQAQFRARLNRDSAKVRELQSEIDAILDANRARAAAGGAA